MYHYDVKCRSYTNYTYFHQAINSLKIVGQRTIKDVFVLGAFPILYVILFLWSSRGMSQDQVLNCIFSSTMFIMHGIYCKLILLSRCST